MRSRTIAILMAGMFAHGAANAQVLVYRLTGVVQTLTDPSGLLGAPATGTSFELDYRADFSLGMFSGATGGLGSTNYLMGGTSYPPDSGPPSLQVSPVSAVLSVGGHDLAFAGDYDGHVQYTQNYIGTLFGGYAVSSADYGAAGRVGGVTSDVTTSLYSQYSALVFGPIDALGTVVVDGDAVSGTASFSWSDGTTTVSGTLLPASLAVAPVPEPAQWLLLALGLAALRLRRAASSAPGKPPARRPRTRGRCPTA
ncbi:PEP-CTERM sorting domain-containing protein [Paucibacter sp. R3-3]|uniref:PEP-CTERM sorting domain-containing protein n=1 Tax=Roseateles agri TaxID=3098619 RepID=A0ABU5DJX5_9BURK|nr:PEP-CTERM sorting domain-containing protein [Paucibacter sp. R3-3]MDY0746010.1 PEP-CTERM sorting domain-containing protein [Paucibacter sp. R3-3]